MIETHTVGRWTVWISPSVSLYPISPADGDDQHIISIYYTGEGTLPNPQQMIGWQTQWMWEFALEYINERHVDDMKEAKQ